MPPINNYKCDSCDFTMHSGWGYYLFVVDDDGNRVVCAHPSEYKYIEKVLGKNPPLELVRERTGFNSYCVCIDCLNQFTANLGKSGWSPYEWEIKYVKPRDNDNVDERKCPQCGSANVKTVLELIGQPCPKCNKGTFILEWTGSVS